MDYATALSYLDSRINYEKLGPIVAGRVEGLSLSGMRALMNLLGDPQFAYPAIHVTGTNGKGSVCRMASALVAATGLSVGTFGSPHLHRVNERICWNLEPISEDEFAEEMTRLAGYEELLREAPTYFELLTAAAFDWFAEVAVDVAVIEVGLLGTYDATNVVDGQVVVVTNIGSDHTDFSAGWREAVAREKSGIIKAGSATVLGEVDSELRGIFTEAGGDELFVLGEDFECRVDIPGVGGRQLTIDTPHGTHEDIFLPLHGAHQAINAATALTAVEVFFDTRLDDDVVREAFVAIELPGRFEIIGRNPLVVVDAAHNPEGASRAATTLSDEFMSAGSRVVIMGLLGGRDPSAMVDAIRPVGIDLLLVCRPRSPRAMDPAAVAEAAEAAGVPVEIVADPAVAVDRALAVTGDEDLLLVLGSFHVVGPARAHIMTRIDQSGASPD